jgi:hypothetical protein
MPNVNKKAGGRFVGSCLLVVAAATNCLLIGCGDGQQQQMVPASVETADSHSQAAPSGTLSSDRPLDPVDQLLILSGEEIRLRLRAESETDAGTRQRINQQREAVARQRLDSYGTGSSHDHSLQNKTN